MTLESYLMDKGIGFEKHTHRTTYTSQTLAQAEHVSGYNVAKPVVVKGATDFAMCVLPAPKHLDLQKAAVALGESEVRLATEAEMAAVFPECELGAEPPVGALFGLKTVMDTQLQEDEYLVMQAGTHTDAIKLRRTDWESLCDPTVASVATS
ncbi:MAG: YbaK/EbsC family protein [Planctomycetota bacterium]